MHPRVTHLVRIRAPCQRAKRCQPFFYLQSLSATKRDQPVFACTSAGSVDKVFSNRHFCFWEWLNALQSSPLAKHSSAQPSTFAIPESVTSTKANFALTFSPENAKVPTRQSLLPPCDGGGGAPAVVGGASVAAAAVAAGGSVTAASSSSSSRSSSSSSSSCVAVVLVLVLVLAVVCTHVPHRIGQTSLNVAPPATSGTVDAQRTAADSALKREQDVGSPTPLHATVVVVVLVSVAVVAVVEVAEVVVAVCVVDVADVVVAVAVVAVSVPVVLVTVVPVIEVAVVVLVVVNVDVVEVPVAVEDVLDVVVVVWVVDVHRPSL